MMNITPDEQETQAEVLVKRIRDGTDKDGSQMLRLMDLYEGFCYIVCRPFVESGIMEKNEILSLSFLAMSQAVKTHDDRRMFITSLRYALLRELTRLVRESGAVVVPYNMIMRLRLYKRTRTEIRREIRHEPTAAMIAERMQTTVSDVENLKRLNMIVNPLQLDKPIRADEECTLGEIVPSGEDVAETVIVSTYNTELRDALTQAIAELPQIEAEIIRERFYHGQTLKATGEHLGRSAEVVRSHEQKALRSLRKQTHLKKFVNRENVYIRTNFGFWKNTGMSAEEWIIIHNEERRQRPQKGKR